MEAIVSIKGFQYKVAPGRKVVIPRLKEEEGSTVKFSDVLMLVDDKGNVEFGKPTLEGVEVEARVVKHFKDKKILVFKKKRRKRYKVLHGHRQPYTLIQILNINK